MAADDPTIVLVHGFTQTSISWRPVIEALGDRLATMAVDAPGHGTARDVRADLSGAASLLASALPDHRRSIVVGYSMGGRIALRLALDHSSRLGGLVLVGATAGIDDPDERAARRSADGAFADRIESEGVAAFLREWLAQPLFSDLAPEADDLAARHANTAEGLASSLRMAGTGTMDPPWWDDLAAISVPVLVVWGANDAKFAALGARLAAAIGPNATTASIPGAGHAAHLERPAAFAKIVDDFTSGLIAGA